MAFRSKISSILQKTSGRQSYLSSQLSGNLHSSTSIAHNLNGSLQNSAVPAYQCNGMAALSRSVSLWRGNTANFIRPFPTQESSLAVYRRMTTTSAPTVRHKSSLGTQPFLNGAFQPIYGEFKDILADYVHHSMTRTLMLVYFRLLLLVVAKDVCVSLL